VAQAFAQHLDGHVGERFGSTGVSAAFDLGDGLAERIRRHRLHKRVRDVEHRLEVIQCWTAVVLRHVQKPSKAGKWRFVELGDEELQRIWRAPEEGRDGSRDRPASSR
jgi:hypothetical protein